MDVGVIVENLPYMLSGLQWTVILASISMVGSFAAGTAFAILRLSPYRWLRWPAILYVDVMRTIPLIMVIFWVFFLLPVLTGQPTTPLKAALLALIAFNTSYMAEVIRAGIQSVPRGQMEAARACGLTYLRAMRFVILPQAIKNMVPALVNRFVALFMGTSLAYIIGVTEFFRAANNVNNRVYRSYEIYTFVAIVYFVCCYSLSLLSRILERRLARAERFTAGPASVMVEGEPVALGALRAGQAPCALPGAGSRRPE
ncbi:MAG: amino acid ABC transporter permease [Candidatus Rokubacteria bacterium]|nr:amino acid ABC transporter permease [Candidatus Rokubacteria bacterium]MBI3105880.1 amino acid ABC transporter permease [Candidatus Rokubacteria bacterium]